MKKVLFMFAFFLLGVFLIPQKVFAKTAKADFYYLDQVNHFCGVGYALGDKIYFSQEGVTDEAYVTVSIIDYDDGDELGHVYNYDNSYGGSGYHVGSATLHTDGSGTGCDTGNIATITDDPPPYVPRWGVDTEVGATTTDTIRTAGQTATGAVASVLPLGVGVMATATLLFKGLGWFKGVAGLRK